MPCPAGELATLLGELRTMHTHPEVRMMIQDLTPNNLLVDDSRPDGAMRLLLADPAMAQPIKLLKDVYRCAPLVPEPDCLNRFGGGAGASGCTHRASGSSVRLVELIAQPSLFPPVALPSILQHARPVRHLGVGTHVSAALRL